MHTHTLKELDGFCAFSMCTYEFYVFERYRAICSFGADMVFIPFAMHKGNRLNPD